MDCMEYMDQVFGNILEVFLKKNLKTGVTFGKMNVALVFFVVDVWKKEKWGVGEIGEAEEVEFCLLYCLWCKIIANYNMVW